MEYFAQVDLVIDEMQRVTNRHAATLKEMLLRNQNR